MNSQRFPARLKVARAALIYAAVVASYMLLSLPLPHVAAPSDRLSWLTVLALVSGAITAVVMLTRRRRIGWALTVGVGLLAGHLLLMRALQFALGRPILPPEAAQIAGPAVVLSFVLAGSAMVALVLAMVCCISLHTWRSILH